MLHQFWKIYQFINEHQDDHKCHVISNAWKKYECSITVTPACHKQILEKLKKWKTKLKKMIKNTLMYRLPKGRPNSIGKIYLYWITEVAENWSSLLEVGINVRSILNFKWGTDELLTKVTNGYGVMKDIGSLSHMAQKQALQPTSSMPTKFPTAWVPCVCPISLQSFPIHIWN